MSLQGITVKSSQILVTPPLMGSSIDNRKPFSRIFDWANVRPEQRSTQSL